MNEPPSACRSRLAPFDVWPPLTEADAVTASDAQDSVKTVTDCQESVAAVRSQTCQGICRFDEEQDIDTSTDETAADVGVVRDRTGDDETSADVRLGKHKTGAEVLLPGDKTGEHVDLTTDRTCLNMRPARTSPLSKNDVCEIESNRGDVTTTSCCSGEGDKEKSVTKSSFYTLAERIAAESPDEGRTLSTIAFALPPNRKRTLATMRPISCKEIAARKRSTSKASEVIREHSKKLADFSTVRDATASGWIKSDENADGDRIMYFDGCCFVDVRRRKCDADEHTRRLPFTTNYIDSYFAFLQRDIGHFHRDPFPLSQINTLSDFDCILDDY